MTAGIVGAGIMGQLLAFGLVNAGWEVTLFDPEVHNNCSQAAAGLLAPVTELEKNPALIYQLGIAALQTHWPCILKCLPQRVFFRQEGSLVVAHPRDRAEWMNFSRHIIHQLSGVSVYELITSDELKKREPQLARFPEAYYFPEEGQLDNQHCLAILSDYLNSRIHKIRSEVTTLEPGKIACHDHIYRFTWVFDCRGLKAKSRFSDLRGIRGELIWLHAPEVNITRPARLLHPRYRIYLVPRPQQIYLIGASELESEDYTPISVRSTLELLSAVCVLQPSFAEARILKTVTHCRPALASQLPRIKYTQGFIAINGLYRHGFLIAPTLMKEVLAFLQQGPSARCYPQIWENSNDYNPG